MKNVKEIEKITGTNRQKIYREIRKNGIKPQKKIDGVNYFSDSILRFFDEKSKTQNETKSEKINDDKSCNNNSFDDFQVIQELKQELKFLRNQIDKKDEQIETLSRLLDQQQRLSLSDKKQLEIKEKKDNKKDESVSDIVSKKNDKRVNVLEDREKMSFKNSFKSVFSKFLKK